MIQLELGVLCLFTFALGCGSPTRSQDPAGKVSAKPSSPVSPQSALPLPQEWRAHVAAGRATLLGSYGEIDQGLDDVGEDEAGYAPPCADDEPGRQRFSLTLGLLKTLASPAASATEREEGDTREPMQSVHFDTPAACIDFMGNLADSSPETFFGSPEFPVAVSLGRVRSKGRVVFATSTAYCVYQACDGDKVEQWSEVATIVGPLVTIVTQASYIGGGGPPFLFESWLSVDLRTGNKASLLDFVDETSLVAAIQKSDLTRFEMWEVAAELAKLSTWTAMHKVLQEHDSTGFNHFAFTKGISMDGFVELQLAFLESPVEQHVTLNLRVKARADVAKYFERAHRPRFVETRGPHVSGISFID